MDQKSIHLPIYSQGSLLFIVLICLSTIGCNNEPVDIGEMMEELEEMDFTVPNIEPTGNEQYLQLGSEYIFDQEKLHTFEILIPKDNLTQINEDPAAEEYVEAALVFQGDTISPIGIRYKGSIGAFVNCLSGTDWAQPSGHKICTKLSMKIKINWEEFPYKFYGLKKLQLHSQNNDNSQLRERLGYWLFREMNVPAPRSVHAKLFINGQYNGLFALTEQIDGRFAKNNFEDSDGNIYKELWPLSDEGNVTSAEVIIASLKTNEDNNPSIGIMQQFAELISSGSNTQVQNTIQKFLDLDEILSYCVVDRTIRHDDGPFHWYCNFSNCTNHNFYWYEEPESEILHLIPWDLDNAFENIISNANPVTPVADDWAQTRNNCQPFSYGTWGLRQKSAACDKLFEGLAFHDGRYQELKKNFQDYILTETQINSMLNSWQDQIREATEEANSLHNDAISLSQWQNAVNELQVQLTVARND